MSAKNGMPLPPPSPSWRSVLHPNRHMGLSLQYKREVYDPIDSSIHSDNSHSRSVRSLKGWSFISPPFIQNVYRQNEEDNLLLTPGSILPGGASNPSTGFVSSSTQPPFLTIVLMKLTKILPNYCRLLAEPTYSSASLACALLGSSVATASYTNSPSNSVGGTPKEGRSPRSPSEMRNGSTSPLSFQYWMPTSAEKKQNSPTASAMALEAEWETFVAPFLLLAGAEVLSAGLEHLRPSSTAAKNNANTASVSAAASLTGLYQRVNQDLVRTQEILCEPFLRVNHPLPTSNNGAMSVMNLQQAFAEAAASLSSSIQLLLMAVSVRCQLIDLQAALYRVGVSGKDATNITVTAPDGSGGPEEADATPDMTQAAAAVTLLLQTVVTATSAADVGRSDKKKDIPDETSDTDGTDSTDQLLAVDPVLSNLIHELKAWKYCFETCAALERCQFLETIVSLRQWQLHLPPKKLDTRLTRWMHKSFQEILSLLPIYFDRAHAYATPFYGFDTAALWQRLDSKKNLTNTSVHRNDWDAMVTDFLRRQEKLGGPPTAVAVVLDAVATSNLHVDRGFRLATDSAHPEAKKEEGNNRALWPAVYLRSTLRLASSSASFRSSPHSSGVLRSSQPSIISSWSSANIATSASANAGSPSGKGGRKQPIISPSQLSSRHKGTTQHHQSVLEYAPDTGTVSSWPHSDWESLAMTLDPSLGAETASAVAPLSTADTPNRPLEHLLSLTYRYDDDEDATEAKVSVRSIDDEASLLSINRLGRLPADRFRKNDGRQSTFYVMSLGEYLSLVVMVKDKEEEKYWHRRRNRLDDNEIRVFMSDFLAKKLRVSSIFSAENLSSLLRKEKLEKTLSLPCDGSLTWVSEKLVDDFLSELKVFFGLRPVSPLHDSSRSLFYGNGSATPRTPMMNNRNSRRRQFRQVAHTNPLFDSAAALFLGPVLAPLVTDD